MTALDERRAQRERAADEEDAKRKKAEDFGAFRRRWAELHRGSFPKNGHSDGHSHSA